MAVQATRTIPARNLRSDDPLETGTQDVPNQSTDITLTPSGTDWTDPTKAGVLVTVTLEQSLDGGSTWQHLCSHQMVAGTMNKAGTGPAPIKCSFQQGASTRLRGTFAVSADIRLGAVAVLSN
jgi:hypothetical protein